jgi:hypothetical protein
MGTVVWKKVIILHLLAITAVLLTLASSPLSRHYSLEVVQHPLRARMCGFGDKVCISSSRPALLAARLV